MLTDLLERPRGLGALGERPQHALVDVLPPQHGDGAVRAELVRVAYDVEAAARGVVDAGLPEEFADFLRTGGKAATAHASGA